MNRKPADYYVKCPFFKRDEENSINCEGVVDGSFLKLSFRSPKKKGRYKVVYCCEYYKDCPLAKTLYQKYEGE